MDDYDDGIIEVQVIPQDDNWGEVATTLTETTATSICSELDRLDDHYDAYPAQGKTCPDAAHACSVLFCLLVGLLSVLSPVAFIGMQ